MTTPQERYAFADVAGPKLNVGCGYDVRDPARGWTNMDAHPHDARVVAWDLTRLPWPFADQSFELVYASHVLEHVPPILRETKGVQRDVLFDVFDEIHRVLRPGGRLVMRVPWGGSHPGLLHIAHYRQWRPEWLYYLEPHHDERVLSSAGFRVVSWERTRDTVQARLPYSLRLGPKKLPLTTHLRARLPFLRWVLEKPAEMVAVLEKLS